MSTVIEIKTPITTQLDISGDLQQHVVSFPTSPIATSSQALFQLLGECFKTLPLQHQTTTEALVFRALTDWFGGELDNIRRREHLLRAAQFGVGLTLDTIKPDDFMTFSDTVVEVLTEIHGSLYMVQRSASPLPEASHIGRVLQLLQALASINSKTALSAFVAICGMELNDLPADQCVLMAFEKKTVKQTMNMSTLYMSNIRFAL